MASLPRIATLIKASASLFLFILLLNSSSCAEAQNVLYPGEKLLSGESLRDGSNYVLTMQTDCNLVLSDAGNIVWQTRTSLPGLDCLSTVQTNGQLVVRRYDGTIRWRSNVIGKNGDYVLVLQKDRGLAIYGPTLWTNGANIAQIAQVAA